MCLSKKHVVILGIFLVNFPNGLTWYYGNLSSYTASSLRYYLGPEVDVETVWLVSVFLAAWTTGLSVGALLLKIIGNARLLALLGCLLFDGAFAFTSWTIQHNLPLYICNLGAIAGLGDGITFSASLALVASWERQRPGLATALSSSSLGFGALMINQIISRYVNPDNLTADKKDGNLVLFSQEEIATRVPSLFYVLALFNFVFHFVGICLIRHKTDDDKTDLRDRSESHIRRQKCEEGPYGAMCTQVTPARSETDLQRSYASDDESSKRELLPRRSRFWTMDSGTRQAYCGQNRDIRTFGSKDYLHPHGRSGIQIYSGSPWGSAQSLVLETNSFSNQFCSKDEADDDRPRNHFLMPGSFIRSYMQRLQTSNVADYKGDTHDRATKYKEPNPDCQLTLEVRAATDDAERGVHNSCVPNVTVTHDTMVHQNNELSTPSKANAENLMVKPDELKRLAEICDVKESSLNTDQHSLNTDQHSLNTDQHNDQQNDIIVSDTCKREIEPQDKKRSNETYESPDNCELTPRSMTPMQMMCTKMFFVLWTAQFCMDYTLTVLSNYYKLYGQLYIQDDHFLALIGTVTTATMILPKLAWGSMLDHLGSKSTFVIMTSSTVVLISFWAYSAMIDRWIYFASTTTLFWCVCAFDNLVAAAVLVSFGPVHYSTNYGLVASSSILLNLVSPLIMQFLLDTLGWTWLFLSVAFFNTFVFFEALIFIHD